MNIAMISGWHVHAEGYAEEIQSMDGCKIVAVWDEDAERGKKWADKLDCPFISDYDGIIADSNIDAVAIVSPTSMHCELMVKAANAKKHIFTEKVLATTKEEAHKIKEAVEKNNIIFTISFVHKARPVLMLAKQMVDSGEIGDVTYARVRNAHDGSLSDWLPPHFYNKEQCGGGAMIDLGAHPLYLLEWYVGKARKVQSSFTNVTDRPVEDNAVSLIEFDNGAIGVAETGFVSKFNPFVVEISGTKGAIYVRDSEYSYVSEKTDGKWVSVTEVPEALLSPVKQWVLSVMKGEPVRYGMDEAVSLSELADAAYRSHRDNKKVTV